MTATELTQKISLLSKGDQAALNRQVDEMLEAQEIRKHFKPYTKDSLVAAIKESHAQAARGEVITHQELLAQVHEKYGLQI